jgi:hypothetical protein
MILKLAIFELYTVVLDNIHHAIIAVGASLQRSENTFFSGADVWNFLGISSRHPREFTLTLSEEAPIQKTTLSGGFLYYRTY